MPAEGVGVEDGREWAIYKANCERGGEGGLIRGPVTDDWVRVRPVDGVSRSAVDEQVAEISDSPEEWFAEPPNANVRFADIEYCDFTPADPAGEGRLRESSTAGESEVAWMLRAERMEKAIRAYLRTQDHSLPLESGAAEEAIALRDLRAVLSPDEES